MKQLVGGHVGKNEAHDLRRVEVLRHLDRVLLRHADTLGIGALRATIKKVAGDGILQVDDVPAWQLLQLLSELQAV
jgi:hypothetical protein